MENQRSMNSQAVELRKHGADTQTNVVHTTSNMLTKLTTVLCSWECRRDNHALSPLSAPLLPTQCHADRNPGIELEMTTTRSTVTSAGASTVESQPPTAAWRPELKSRRLERKAELVFERQRAKQEQDHPPLEYH